MKNILFIAALFFTLNIAAQDTLYVVQIMSTRNPELVKPEHIIELPDTAMIEQSGEWWRVLFVYPDDLTAWIYLHTWKRAYPDAFIRKVSKAEVKKFIPLFSQI